MKNKTDKLLSLLALTVLCLSTFFTAGCDAEDNPVTGFLYEEVGGSHVVTDQFGNKLIFTGDQVKQLLAMEDARMKEFITARFQNEYPASYTNGQAAIIKGEENVDAEIVVGGTAQTAVNALGYIPVWGDIASLTANGLLAIGAIWLGKRKKTAQKVNESLVKGIDVFRDVLDQTPQGEQIDAALTGILKDRQSELGTLKEVNKLLDRFATPTKKPLILQ